MIILTKHKLEILQTMELNKQSQNAGDNSTQMQATTINNYYSTVSGIDETRARDICKEEYAIARQNWSSEAAAIADERVNKLENKLMPKMVAYDNTLRFFADPDFQFTLRRAQMSAAASERESDYELLSELLLHRVKQGCNRERRLGISKAIDVVNQITDEALLGLTMVYVVSKFIPASYDLIDGFNVLNELYGNIIFDCSLPSGDNWMEHLDLLSAIRLGAEGINKFKKLNEYMPSQLSKYLVSGIENDSQKLIEIRKEFEQNNIPVNNIVNYPLKQNHVYLNLSYDSIDHLEITKGVGNGIVLKTLFSEQQKSVMKNIFPFLNKDESNNTVLKNKLMEVWDTYPNLKNVKTWWDSLPYYFNITPVGVALANAFAQSKAPNVPSLY